MKDHRPYRKPFSRPAQMLMALPILLVTPWAAANILLETSIPITSEEQTLLVINSSDSNETFWLIPPQIQASGREKAREDAGKEISFDIEAHAKLRVPLSPWQNSPWLRIQALSPNLKLFVHLGRLGSSQNNDEFSPWPWGTSNTLILPRGLPHAVLWLSNLTGEKQNFSLQGLDPDSSGKTQVEYLSGTLEPYQTHKWTWRGTAGALMLKSDLRVSALLEDALSKKTYAFTPLPSHFKNQTPPVPINSARFILANSAGTQSFVVEINNPEQIALARRQIAEPTSYLQRMLVARVESGSAQMNYDDRGLFQAPWSWHVAQVYRFADFGSIDCDGSPQLMEQTLSLWLSARNGLICFWDYKIKSELKSQLKSELTP